MFKEISNVFDRKISQIVSYQDKDQEIKKTLKAFLEKEFGENLKGFSFIIKYNFKDNTLSISAENKILANELSLRLVDLNEYLQKRGIKLERILVR